MCNSNTTHVIFIPFLFPCYPLFSSSPLISHLYMLSSYNNCLLIFFLMVILAYHCKIAVGQSTSSRFQLSCFYVGKYRWPNLACNLQASYYNCLPYFLLLSFHISDHYRFRALFCVLSPFSCFSCGTFCPCLPSLTIC